MDKRVASPFFSMGLKTVAQKALGNAAGWFAAGSFFETALQYGLTEVHRITQGASGQESINWSSVLTAGAVGGVLGGAGTRLAYSERFNQGVEVVGNVMQKLGEIVGLGASKSKLVAGQVPDAGMGTRLELGATRPGGRDINLLDESIPTFRGGETVTLGGKALFKVPTAETFIRQEALDWYIQQYNQMVKQIDIKLPVAKQLELLDKAGQSLRKAAEAALIDRDAVAEFAERLFKPGLNQVTQKLLEQFGLSGEALQKKVLDELRLPAIGCFVAGTLVHTKEGLKPIEQIKVGDWVLSRPENPEQGTETGYKRVTKTFRFEDKEVVRFWWAPNAEAEWAQTESVYVTPNHPVWLNPNGWVAMGRLTLPEKHRPGFIMRGDGDWLTHELILADGTTGSMLDVFDLYRTDKPTIAFKEEDDWDLGTLYDFSGISPTVGDSVPYDYEKWGDPVNETRERYTTTVYNFEVEDWHTYFVGKMGLWVHNTNCADATLTVQTKLDTVDALIKDAIQMGSQGTQFKKLTKAELNHFLKNNPDKRDGFGVIRMDGAGKYKEFELGDIELPKGLAFEDGGPGRLIDAGNGTRYEYAVLINKDTWTGQVLGTDLAKRLDQARYVKMENSYFTDSGTRVWADRKADTTSLSNKTLQFKPLDQLFRWALTAQSNPADRFAIEVAKDAKQAWPAYQELLTKIRKNEIVGEFVNADGKVLYTASDTQFVLDKIRTYLLKVDASGNPLKDVNGNALKPVLELVLEGDFSKVVPFPQNVPQEGTSLTVETLDPALIYLQLGQARQYWLDQGASLARLNQASFAVADLPQGWAARTEGTQITLDTNGAGWGWFVDPSPEDNAEFVPLDSADPAAQGDYTAAHGSEAEGKLDLLTVLIHELGHVLGLPMPQSADGSGSDGAHAMSQYLSPGQRRLPDAVDIAALQASGWGAYLGNTTTLIVGTTVVNAPTQVVPSYQATPNPALTNPDFAGNTGWSTTGTVSFANSTAVLTESATAQTRLNQLFVVGENDRYLRFTLADIALDDVNNAPDDAFEVALINANSGLSLLGGTGLTRSDALLNLQANGTERAAPQVIRTLNADGSRTYLVDLTGITVGTVASLSFDLIGFGRAAAAASSHLTVRDLSIGLGVPQTHDDTATTAEDMPVNIAVLANDLDSGQSGFVPVVVASPAHGQVVLNADGSFGYTPDQDWYGDDSFSYKLSSNGVDSNVAIVLITVTPVNDAPVASANTPLAAQEDTATVIDLLAQASDVDSASLTVQIVDGPTHQLILRFP